MTRSVTRCAELIVPQPRASRGSNFFLEVLPNANPFDGHAGAAHDGSVVAPLPGRRAGVLCGLGGTVPGRDTFKREIRPIVEDKYPWVYRVKILIQLPFNDV